MEKSELSNQKLHSVLTKKQQVVWTYALSIFLPLLYKLTDHVNPEKMNKRESIIEKQSPLYGFHH